MADPDRKQGELPFGATVTGYGYFGLGGTMGEHLPRELERRRQWQGATDRATGSRNAEIEILKREKAERRKMLERGEMEGPPNPYKPHRKR